MKVMGVLALQASEWAKCSLGLLLQSEPSCRVYGASDEGFSYIYGASGFVVGKSLACLDARKTKFNRGAAGNRQQAILSQPRQEGPQMPTATGLSLVGLAVAAGRWKG